MAETCIVCLGDLATRNSIDASRDEYSLDTDGVENPSNLEESLLPTNDALQDDSEYIAHLLPCGHDLHNECLKPWVERANSCPICRANFNTVELSAKLGGPMITSYAVQDKTQVADIDPSMIVAEDFLLEEDEPSEGCMVCEDFGDPSQLMECNGCELLCHVFCAGLDTMPEGGPWYCQTCLEDPQVLNEAASRPQPRNPAAFRNGRNRRRHADRQPNAWTRVWQTVWDRLHLDLDFPFDDDGESTTGPPQIQRTPAEQAERREWERRFRIAERNGAGNRFRQTAAILHHAHAHSRIREPPKPAADPESQEELRAWNAFEKAKEQLRGGSSSSGRRKRKSPTSSPSEPEHREPPRKLKRPRTRMNLELTGSRDVGEPSSAAPAPRIESPRNGIRESVDASGVVPGFLRSLLQEVEKPAPVVDEEIAAPQPRRVIIERACSPQHSSPGLSPVYPTPRGMTPPPLNISSRPQSPELQPSPELSPASSRFPPYSPADEEPRPGRRRKGHRSPAALSSPPRSKDSSPTRPNMSYSTKAEIQRMVKVTLKPFYTNKEITGDQYTDINRDVSRMLYDKVGDANALADSGTREKWQKIASEEVGNAVRAIRVAADDIGASSSS